MLVTTDNLDSDGIFQHSLQAKPLEQPFSPPFTRIPFEIINSAGRLNDQALERMTLFHSEGVDTIYEWLLQRAEDLSDRGVVSRIVGGLAIARGALTIEELTVLGRKSQRSVLRILELLHNHVADDDGNYRILQPDLRTAVLGRYAPNVKQRRKLHLNLASVYAGTELGARRIAEEPWHLFQAEAWPLLRDFLTQVPVIIAFNHSQAMDLLVWHWNHLSSLFDPDVEYQKSAYQYFLRVCDRQMFYKTNKVIAELLHALHRSTDAEKWERRRHASNQIWSCNVDVSEALVPSIFSSTLTEQGNEARLHFV